MLKSKHTSGKELGMVVEGVASSTQRITMVTAAVRRLRRVWLGQRGTLERQLTEESSLTLDGSTVSHPRHPPHSSQSRDVANPVLWAEGKKWNERQDSTT